MAKYRKKPVIIEAIQFTFESMMNPDGVLKFTNGTAKWMNSPPPPYTRIIIKTLEGNMVANQGDWIIRGIKGEFYPCKPEIFEATYEKVEDSEAQDET